MKVTEADFLAIREIHKSFLKTPFIEENIPIYEKLTEKIIKILKRYFKKESGVLEDQLTYHQIFVRKIMLYERDAKYFSPSESLYYYLSMIYEKKLDILKSYYEHFISIKPVKENIEQLANLIDNFSLTMLAGKITKKSFEISKNQLYIKDKDGYSVGHQRAKDTMKSIIDTIEMYV